MKVKVTEAFIDKRTGKNHEVGEIFEADEKRIKEIQSVKASLIKVMKKAPTEAPAEAEDKKTEKKGR